MPEAICLAMCKRSKWLRGVANNLRSSLFSTEGGKLVAVLQALKYSFKSPFPINSNNKHIGLPIAHTPSNFTIFGWSKSANRQASLSKSSFKSWEASSLSIFTATSVNSSSGISPGALA
ncbi:unnamed protein product [Spodoptera exigua]|nr:unnamed protein product [Spodoptera exigua]